LSIDGDVVMRGENLGGSGSEKLGEDGRGSEGGGRVQKKLPMGLDSFLSLLLV
jgi:hypothetical protein